MLSASSEMPPLPTPSLSLLSVGGRPHNIKTGVPRVLLHPGELGSSLWTHVPARGMDSAHCRLGALHRAFLPYDRPQNTDSGLRAAPPGSYQPDLYTKP